MHQGHARPVPPEIEGRDGSRVLASDDHDIHVEKRMGFAIVVKNLGEVFAGNIQRVGQIVVAGRDNQFAGAVVINAAQAVGSCDMKIVIAPGHGLDPLILADIEMIVLGDFAVVLERFLARGLLPRGAEGNVADFQQLRRGKERHVGGIVIDGIDHASLVDGHDFEAGALGFDGAGQSGGPGADHDHIGTGVGLALHLRARKGVGNLLGRAGALFRRQIVGLAGQIRADHERIAVPER